MGTGNMESTRAFDAAVQPADRTLAVPGIVDHATRMGATVPCPVCGTANSDMETYCTECGFALASTPGEASLSAEPDDGGFALVESGSGRRIPLRVGLNAVGREGADGRQRDPPGSRRHAEITVSSAGVEVRDLGSTNGTQIDGVPMAAAAPVSAAPGAMLRFGSALFVLSGPATSIGPAEPTMVVVDATEEADASPIAPVAEAAARLVATEGASTDIEIRQAVTTVGRRTSNAHVISDDPYVSGTHAQFALDGSDVCVMDMGSTNGTMVNGEKLQPDEPFALHEGDEIQIGQGRYVLRLAPGDAALDTEDELTTEIE